MIVKLSNNYGALKKNVLKYHLKTISDSTTLKPSGSGNVEGNRLTILPPPLQSTRELPLVGIFDSA